MKFRGLLAAVVVLLILGGVLYWSEHRKTPERAASDTTGPQIVKINPPDVTTLTVKLKGAQPVTLLRSSTGQWQITSPSYYRADDTTVYTLLAGLGPLNSERVVEDQASNLAQFGLSDPATEIDVTTKDKKTTRVLIGDDTPTGEGVYAAVAGDPHIYAAASFVKTSLGKSLSDLRDKRLLPVDADSVSSIDLVHKNDDIGFARIQHGWQIEKPKSYRTDSVQVDDLLQQLTSAKWDASATAADATKAFAHADPLATVKLTGSSGTDTLEVRKDKTDYYAKSSALDGIWKIDPSTATSLGETLGRTIDDFRSKQLFTFAFAEPEKIEWHSGATSVVLTRSGNDWWSNGKKMDRDSVENLVTALRDVTATKFVDSGFTTPQIDITVTSGGGQKIEKVQIQKTSDGALAKLGDDTTFYAIDTATADSLTNSIAAIKPSTPGKK